MKIKISLSSHEWRYAMVNRPVGIGCNPKEGFIRSEERPARGKEHYDMARNGVAVYNRKLTDHETKQFEMALMAEGKDLDDVAKSVAADMSEYAAQYVRMSEKNHDQFADRVMSALKESSKGYRPSVGDLDQFAKLVVDQLKRVK